MKPSLGFETIGNATVIVYENGSPLLVTDPWIEGSAYFGSWILSHEVPLAQREACLSAPFVWFSHGHPDHLNPECLGLFKDKMILLPDHAGGRIKNDLVAMGYNVHVLPDRQWTELGPEVKVFSIADYNQDGVLLIDVGGKLILNLNDASDHGWSMAVKKEAKKFKTKILLALFGYGDADMINFFDESGKRIEPWAARKMPVGATVAKSMKEWGANYCIPFSSLHHYQRSDSVWANEYVTHPSDYAIGFDAKAGTLLPAFVWFDCRDDSWGEINPRAVNPEAIAPEVFGDSWNERLKEDDQRRIESYFKKVVRLDQTLESMCFRVGGEEFNLKMGKKNGRAITFEVPRNSLMIAVDNRIFDDLLIGNFMKTTLQGAWPAMGLYPDFSPFLAKYSDNGNAHSATELEHYFTDYRKRAPLDYMMHRMRKSSHLGIRNAMEMTRDTPIYTLARSLYRKLK